MSDERAPLSSDAEARLERYRAGGMPLAEREAFERNLLRDETLAEALYAHQSLNAAVVAAKSRSSLPRPSGSRVFALAASLVAVASAVLLMMRMRPGEEAGRGETLRGGPVSPAQPLAPVGSLAAPPKEFRWRRDPEAEAYRLEVFANDGRIVVTLVVHDTLVAARAAGADTLHAGSWVLTPIGSDGLERPAHPAVLFEVARR